MSESDNCFRIVLDLSRYFFDHRRIARIFIKNRLKTIKDLHDRISNNFCISDFYLTSGGQYLPVLEDIRVLHHDETVCVIPDQSNGSHQNLPKIALSLSEPIEVQNKQHKRALEDIPEEPSQTSTKKKKKKSIEYISSSNTEDENSYKKKKKYIHSNMHKSDSSKKTNYNSYINSSTPDRKSKTNKQEQSIVVKELCQLESAKRVLEVKKKLKGKADTVSSRYSNTPIKSGKEIKMQNSFKKGKSYGRLVPDTVPVSRRADTPINSTKYIPPQRNTAQYLAKNKINIISIDVVKSSGEENLITTNKISKNQSQSVTYPDIELDPNSPPQNYVKTVVNSIEKHISPISTSINHINSNDIEPKQNYTNFIKTHLNQSNKNTLLVLGNKSEASTSSEALPVKLLPSSNNILPKSFLQSSQSQESFSPINGSFVGNENASNDVSMDISSINQGNASSCEASYDTTLNTTKVSVESNNNISQKSKAANTNRILMGIGALVEQLRESDSLMSQESDTSSQYVTKRKRVRKRKRQSKKNEKVRLPDQTLLSQSRPKPMITKVLPNVHIKFNDADKIDNEVPNTVQENNLNIPEKNGKQESQVDTDQRIVNSGEHQPETLPLSDENEGPIMESKTIFGLGEIQMAPLMGSQLKPKLGDVVAFKVLKMNSDYTPIISDYIVGKIQTDPLENQSILFKILSGSEELLVPSGKLSLNNYEDENNGYPQIKHFLWSELIEPKLLHP